MCVTLLTQDYAEQVRTLQKIKEKLEIALEKHQDCTYFFSCFFFLLFLLERQRLFQRRGLVPRHKPAGPVGYVESSKSMSRSEREAGRRPFQLIMTLSNSLPIQ